MFQSLETEEIEKKISKRKQFIMRVVSFIEVLALRIGKVSKGDERRVREVDDIQGFYFITDTGTHFGGEDYIVKYRSRVVFSVRSRAGNYQITNFDENLDCDWQNKLERLINHAKEFLWEFEKKEEELKNEKKRKEENKKKRELFAEAKILKLKLL